MVSNDEKLDILVEDIQKIVIDMEVLKTRVDSIDVSMQKRADAMCNIYDYMQKTDERLIKLETNHQDEALMRSWFAPYILAVFSSIASYLVFHFIGG